MTSRSGSPILVPKDEEDVFVLELDEGARGFHSSTQSSPLSINIPSSVNSPSETRKPSQNVVRIFPSKIPDKVSKVEQIGNFKLGKTLGVGSFVAKHMLTGHEVAVKIINRKKIKSLRMDYKIKREITNMKLFRHPHIIKLYEVIETATDIFMIMEYVSGGEIFEYICKHGKLAESEARKLFQQIISGVEYCHAHMVVHRDLKPENLLLKNTSGPLQVKIADFGLSTMMHDGDFLKTSCGSPNYAAPEVISGKLYAGPEVDVWSCGVILYTLVCAKLPFDDDYIPALFSKIRAGEFQIPSHVSEGCASLIKAMIVVDPLKRITIPEIRKHPWFMVDIPSYLAEPHTIDLKVMEKGKLDEEVVEEIAHNFGVSEETVMSALKKKGQVNEFVVAYDLISDHKKQQGPPSQKNSPSKRLSQEILATSVKMFSHSYPMNLRLSENEINEMEDNPNLVYFPLKNEEPLLAMSPISSHVFSPPLSPILSPRRPLVPPRQNKEWGLGLVISSNPDRLMEKVLEVLKSLQLEWKTTGPYQLQCRTREDSHSSFPIKFILQIYKVKEKKYLLDVKNLGGHTFPFFHLCQDMLALLKGDDISGSNGL